ncbi:hypothetical protein E4T56_gene14028 [Termitomyces sp. T112]|nr:hypothetical protein E4T56_gene14028 [Termitomyces sp. T112]
MQLSISLSLFLVAITLAYPVPRNGDNLLHIGGAHTTNGLIDVNTDSVGFDVSKRDLDAYQSLHELVDRDVGSEDSVIVLARAAGTAVIAGLSKGQKNNVKEYLENIPTDMVEVQFGNKKWLPWHGDNKSQATSDAHRAFQTQSLTNGADFLTIVSPKKDPKAWIKYTSRESEDAHTIVSAMLAVLQ